MSLAEAVGEPAPEGLAAVSLCRMTGRGDPMSGVTVSLLPCTVTLPP